ncbi:MAG: purine phosphoribosyltransferase family protein [Campylobacter hyointestinalis]
MKKLSVADKDYLLSTIRDVKDFPKPGILFKDITTLLNDKKAFKFLMDHLEDRYKDENLDFIVGIESRGFILGAALASKLDLPFVPVRKPHKLPYRVLLVDDLIATGGTAIAACDLIANVGANLVEACFLIDLLELGGSKNLKTRYPIYSILEV